VTLARRGPARHTSRPDHSEMQGTSAASAPQDHRARNSCGPRGVWIGNRPDGREPMKGADHERPAFRRRRADGDPGRRRSPASTPAAAPLVARRAMEQRPSRPPAPRPSHASPSLALGPRRPPQRGHESSGSVTPHVRATANNEEMSAGPCGSSPPMSRSSLSMMSGLAEASLPSLVPKSSRSIALPMATTAIWPAAREVLLDHNMDTSRSRRPRCSFQRKRKRLRRPHRRARRGCLAWKASAVVARAHAQRSSWEGPD
jgi:hypothetical protein